MMERSKRRFITLYVLGEEFCDYHYDVKVADFISWIKKKYPLNYSAWKVALDLYKSRDFKSFLEDTHYGVIKVNDLSKFKKSISEWFRCYCHRSFHFLSEDIAVFAFEGALPILDVIYNLEKKLIYRLGNNRKEFFASEDPNNVKCIWLIGINEVSDVFDSLIDFLSPVSDRSTTHFKIISDNKDRQKQITEKLSCNGFKNLCKLQTTQVTVFPTGEIEERRKKRNNDFKIFESESNERFRKIALDYKLSDRFNKFYSFNVYPFHEGNDSEVKVVTAGWGNRPYAASVNIREFHSKVESGARLTFTRMDTGYVMVALYPAHTEESRPIEDFILLEKRYDPAKLLKERNLRRFYRYLLAYMEETCLDRNPSICDRLQVWCLRLIKHQVIENKYQPTKIFSSLSKFIKVLFTVGCSGFIFILPQWWYYNTHPDTSVQESCKEIVEHLDNNTDSLKLSIERLEKEVKQIQEANQEAD